MANNSNETSYFKVGMFVLVGIGLIIFALLVFGTEKVFQPIVYVETYFEESIQGVSEGSPVRYRGLQIGYVDDIAFTSEMYGYGSGEQTLNERVYDRSIYVKIAITSKLFTQLSSDKVKQFLSREVDQGLRVKLVAQGLTGISYLEFDYVDPETYPIPKLDWQPKFFYIPTVVSTLTRLSENAQYILNELKDVDFKKLFSDLDSLIISFDRFSDSADNLLNRIDQPAIRIVQDLKVITEDLRTVSDRLKLKPSELIFGSYPPPLDPGKL